MKKKFKPRRASSVVRRPVVLPIVQEPGNKYYSFSAEDKLTLKRFSLEVIAAAAGHTTSFV